MGERLRNQSWKGIVYNHRATIFHCFGIQSALFIVFLDIYSTKRKAENAKLCGLFEEKNYYVNGAFSRAKLFHLRILQTFGKCNIVECKLHVKPFRPRHGFSLRHDGARRGRERSSNLLVSGFMVELLRSWLSSGRRLRDNRTSNRIKLNDALSLPTEGHFANPIVHLHRNPTNDDLVAH